MADKRTTFALPLELRKRLEDATLKEQLRHGFGLSMSDIARKCLEDGLAVLELEQKGEK